MIKNQRGKIIKDIEESQEKQKIKDIAESQEKIQRRGRISNDVNENCWKCPLVGITVSGIISSHQCWKFPHEEHLRDVSQFPKSPKPWGFHGFLDFRD